VQISPVHEWNLSPAEAIALQQRLAGQLIYDRPLDVDAVTLVGGVDVSVRRSDDGQEWSHAAVVILRLPEFQIVETVTARLKTPFPYIPGLLTFREGEALLAAFDQLQHIPDVFIFDGMGRAHPRRMGIAAHMGLWLQVPTIGCGKSHLVGAYEEPPQERGAHSLMTHRGEVIGAALRTRPKTKPVYISPGHLIDLDSSLKLVMRCSTRYRLPEPIRAAHHAAGQFSAD